MGIWRTVAMLAMLLLAGSLFAAVVSKRRYKVALGQITGLNAQITALHRALQEQQTSQRELAHRAVHDPLTGLAGRSLLTERLGQALPDAALITLDLDGFTDINDALGQATSDALLVEVARRLRTVARHIDTVARIGGDEFAILLPEASRQRAQLSSVRIMDAMRQSFQVSGRRVRMTASLGMITSGGHETAADALRDADLAMSAAKADGGDRLVEFQPELREDRLRRAKMATDLRAAIEGDELTLHYQPIVSLDSGQPVALEALARWSPSGGDPIPPSQFIPVAEQTGLVVQLGARILRDACAQGRRWHERYGTSIGVNISGRQLLEPDFAELVLAVLGDTGLPGTALILEITETVMVAASGPDGQAATSRLDRLRAHGVRVAIDDFGTGYSSLSYLHRLPIDILKIDSEFVQALDEGWRRGAALWGTGRGEPARRGGAHTRAAQAAGGTPPGLIVPGGEEPRRSVVATPNGLNPSAAPARHLDATGPVSAGGPTPLRGFEADADPGREARSGRGGRGGRGFGRGLGQAVLVGAPEFAEGQGTSFAQAILRLAQSLQLVAVAEGVETERQAEVLRAMGCPLAQGYLFAYPARAEEIENYLAANRHRVTA